MPAYSSNQRQSVSVRKLAPSTKTGTRDFIVVPIYLVRLGDLRVRLDFPLDQTAMRIDRANAAPSAPSPRDPGRRNAASPADPQPDTGIARFTGAKTSVGTAIAL